MDVIFGSLAIVVAFSQRKTHDFASPPFDGFAIDQSASTV
jgi:hypothetical protein